MASILQSNDICFRPREMAFFMSIFDANKRQSLSVDQVTHALFKETDLQYLERKNAIPKGPAPKHNGYLFGQGQQQRMNNVDFREGFKVMRNHDQMERVRGKFQKAYQRNGVTALGKWKDFDVDADGIVSVKDVADRLDKLAVFGHKDMGFLIEHFCRHSNWIF